MNIKHLLSSVALAATTLACGSAFAAGNVALGKTTTASSTYESPGGESSLRFTAGEATDGKINDDPYSAENSGIWLAAQDGIAGEWVQVDLGASYLINSITLYDTSNRQYDDRGTNEFTLSVSSDGSSFSEIASGAFTNDQWLNQTALTVGTLSATGRYVRFNVVSGYGGSGAGLAEIQVYGTAAPVPEPETYAMMLAGLGLMGAIARRRKSKAA